MENEIKAINPLHQIIMVAKINQWIINQDPNYNYSLSNFMIPIPEDSVMEPFEMLNGRTLYDSKELAGVAGMFQQIEKSDHLLAVYSNDLGSQLRGIDAIARSGKEIIFCEAKGTVTDKHHLSQFLRKTKTKGRQMSWRWIWRSVTDFAEDPRNANVFLATYHSIIRGQNISRLVFISYLTKVKDKYAILKTVVYGELEISKLNKMNEFPAKSRLNMWLDEIEAIS